jgi:hypothetical protein
MNAKMRIGHFTKTQPLRLRVKMATLKSALIGGILAIGATQSMAGDLPNYDTNLERWAKERLAVRMGDIRDSYQPSEALRMVTEIDVKRGPMPLSAERKSDPMWVMATLRFGEEINITGPVFQAIEVVEAAPVDQPYPPRKNYRSAMVLAKN